ncbi:MAG: FliI/YscN family ATPase [Nitrospinaceae bacterium]|nr:FliI/YscN family ATPase [Nitrospinaceae bacterium]NIR57701.1 FliI/YscN family ATPase [Nitrospinaceae bacterium]NIS88165.1 FliI/YscN family ATPase [Nitrospinaceae bacterium]NIT85043.1 FliI/YscN family ATPase [Nitrospinaceae bacterium]NIU47205.1 FliI/YscN family ATPase [Nitrospinaceae bacterium]
MTETINLDKYRSFVENVSFVKKKGRVNRITGLILEGDGPAVSIGSLCTIHSQQRQKSVHAEVVGFRDNKILLMALEDMTGIEPGSVIESREEYPLMNVSDGLLGRVLDGTGRPLDGGGPIPAGSDYPILGTPANPLEKQRIKQPLDVGIRAINSLLTCGKGQRLGIMAGTGVGKSILLGMIARNTSADVNVVALIGERGREVKEFIEENLGPEGLKKSVVVAAASDQPPLVRLRGAFIAHTIAEYFRDQGKDVLLMMDSITRFSLAQREIGLSIGEPPTTRGYTPSVFSLLPRLLERAGTSTDAGTITGLYTVLVEGDDLNEPISDAVRAILDGHIVLSRKLSSHNHYPAIDVLESISRLMIDVVSQDQYELSMRFKDILATYREAEDLINIGAYAEGSNPKIDLAIQKFDQFNQFLRQGIRETAPMAASLQELKSILEA